MDASEVPKHDVLCGGFPCQSFSIAGKRKGFVDSRGTLFEEIRRVAEHHRPKVLFLENVKGLLSAPLVDENGKKLAWTKGYCFFHILDRLGQLGYDVEWQVLNSKHWVPQNRPRVFIVGHLGGESRSKIFPLGQGGQETSVLQGQQADCALGAITARRGTAQSDGDYVVEGHGEAQEVSIEYFQNSRHEIARVYKPEGLSPALHRKTGGWQEPKIAIPVLTPDRPGKRQNGRRFKEDGEPMFALTGQDRHGVAIISHSPRSGDPKKGGTDPLISDKYSFTVDSTPHSDAVRTDGEMITPALKSELAHSSRKNFTPKWIELQMRMGLKIRRLTPIECERLQGFPDNWTSEGIINGKIIPMSDTNRYSMVGNAVTVNVIQTIGERILERWVR